MSRVVWNVFDLFVVIETKINFSSEFLFADDSRLEVRENQLSEAESGPAQSDCLCFSEPGQSSHLFGMPPSVADSGFRRTDPFDDEHRSLVGNFLVPTCAQHDDFTSNMFNYGLMQKHSFDMRYIKSARGSKIRRCWKLSSDPASAAARSTPAEAVGPAPVHADSQRANQLHENDSRRPSLPGGSKYTTGQLIILSLNLVVVLAFLLRLVMNSLGKSYHSLNDAHASRNITIPPAAHVHDVDTKSTNWRVYLTEVLASDLFASFTNRRMVNMVAAGSLVPSAVLRLIRIQRYLRLYLFHWARKWIGGVSITSPKNDSGNGAASKATGMPSERINIVQSDLCYLKSLYTSSSDWCEMLTKSWFHKHKFRNFLQEREMLTKFCRNADKRGHQSSLAACDLITKMYYYNLINFDSCYVKYFQQASVSGVELEHNQETMADGGHLGLTIDNSAKSGGHVDQDANQKQESSKKSAGTDCCVPERKKSKAGEESKLERDIFVAKPLHRMDLTEMGWLLVALSLLYGLSASTLVWQALFSLLAETNVATFSDISPSRMLIELRLFVSTSALTRWLLINVLDVIVILTIFDLYQFFACCLICLSRARYLMFRLAQMSDYCQLTSHLLEQEQDLLDRVGTRRIELECSGVCEELAAFKSCAKRFGSQSKRFDKQAAHISPASIAAVRELNIELKFMMNLILIIQQELSDLKKFFSLYLNLELAFKSLCMTFSICALLDSNNVFELCYLLSVFNNCTTPIFITMITAALIENEFRGVCRNLNRIIITGGPIMSVSNLRQVIQLSSFLSAKANRSFVVVGNFSLSLRSLVPILAWIATGVVMIRRDSAA